MPGHRQTDEQVAARLPLVEAELAAVEAEMERLGTLGGDLIALRLRRKHLVKTVYQLTHLERYRELARANSAMWRNRRRPPDGRPLGDNRAVVGRQMQAVSSLRAPDVVDGRCPRCGNRVLFRNFDGVECVTCGWAVAMVARPLPLEAD